MILLAIDSSESCSAALLDSAGPAGGRLLARRRLEPGRGQAERLIELVEAVLADAGLCYGSLGGLAVNQGPGSFTGLRSAVAAARGLALATDLGVIPVSSLEALAESQRSESGGSRAHGAVLTALDARRGEVYAQLFGPDLAPLDGPAGAPRAVPPEEAAAWVASGPMVAGAPLHLVGSGAHLIHTLLPAELPVMVETVRPDALLVARRAARRLAAGEEPVSGFEVRPLYLRAPDARPQVPLVPRPRARAAARRAAS